MPTPLTPVQEQIFTYFPIGTHPVHRLNAAIEETITPESVVLDIGCGRTAPTLVRWIGKAKVLHGVDIVDFRVDRPELTLHISSVTDMSGIATSSVDVAYSQAVMEHLDEPGAALAEIRRVLKPGGKYIFLTPSIYDYASIIAALVPNKWHPKLVKWMTGRKEEDVFPTYFRANSKHRITKLAAEHEFEIAEFAYLGQYPAYLVFNRVLFWLGALYERIIRRFEVLHPLQGWVFCVLRKPEAVGGARQEF